MAARTRRRAPARPVGYPGGRPAGAPTTTTGRTQVTARQAAGAVTGRHGRYSARHMLTAELITGVIIVAIRAVADYEPQSDGTLKGKVGHPKGQYGPLPILAGLIVTFFLLSFLAASGGTKAKVAVIFGGVVDLALLMNSSGQFVKVAATFGDFGKAKVPPGSWQTSGTEAGAAVSGTIPDPLVPARGGGVAPQNPQHLLAPTKGKCPKGWTLVDGKCWPNAQQNPQPL